MIVIARIDLDVLDTQSLSDLIMYGYITLGDATEAKCIREMSELEKLMWVRSTKLLTQYKKVG